MWFSPVESEQCQAVDHYWGVNDNATYVLGGFDSRKDEWGSKFLCDECASIALLAWHLSDLVEVVLKQI